MTFIPATESAIVHPSARREELPIEILIELDAFEATLDAPEAAAPASDDVSFDDFLSDFPELDAEDLEFLEEAPVVQELPSSAVEAVEVWPRDFETHLAEIKAAGDDAAARRALSLMGLGDIFGLEQVVASISKTSEALVFWQPMLDMEQDGFFSLHHKELQACLALLEAHPAPEYHPALRQRWEAARDELLELLPTWATRELAVA
jgi:hypothetical protein